ncbi:hypothetical protein [Streptomyces acidiscabies]|uniref:Uncharacterized protein n=1 Tax=Streptomyces acidiscabies TaxID=42234 RepID=A0ABU4M8I9_9ACTN|nr:hypothetical protein [Streptomyces acidiscabies]MDX3024046.1 hypothetical protein [Streptomyces acidiscabies]
MYRIWLIVSALMLAAVLALADDGRPAAGTATQPGRQWPTTSATPVGR